MPANGMMPAMLLASSPADGSPQIGPSSLRPPPTLAGSVLAPTHGPTANVMRSESSSGYSSGTASPAAFGATAQRARSRSPSGLRDGRVTGGKAPTPASLLVAWGWTCGGGVWGALDSVAPAPSPLLPPLSRLQAMPRARDPSQQHVARHTRILCRGAQLEVSGPVSAQGRGRSRGRSSTSQSSRKMCPAHRSPSHLAVLRLLTAPVCKFWNHRGYGFLVPDDGEPLSSKPHPTGKPRRLVGWMPTAIDMLERLFGLHRFLSMPPHPATPAPPLSAHACHRRRWRRCLLSLS